MKCGLFETLPRFPRARARYKNYFWPALVRQYGEIEGPYVLQMDACKCLANGVDRFNDYMGREAIRVIFRGRDEEDPKARCAGRPWSWGRGHLGNLGRGHTRDQREETTLDFCREMYGAPAKKCSGPENRDASISSCKHIANAMIFFDRFR